jgi:hypothetical protein
MYEEKTINGYETPTLASPDSPLHQAQVKQNTEIAVLWEAVRALQKRLEPVLMSDTTDAATKAQEGFTGRSTAVVDINLSTNEIVGVRSTINDLLVRLEV